MMSRIKALLRPRKPLSTGAARLHASVGRFPDKLWRARFEFGAKRADYYYDLAMRIEKMPGEPISNHFAKDAARRAGEPLGILAALWLARTEGLDGETQESRLAEILRGTVPDEDLAILAVAEQGGDLKQGLFKLAENLRAMHDAKANIVIMLASLGLTLIILHVYVGAMAFIVAPMLDRSFASLLPVDAYGPIAKTFHYAAQFLRNWGWLVLAGELALGYWVVKALKNYTGKYRQWLDNKVILFDFFRRFQGAQFLSALSAVTQRFGGDSKNLSPALDLMREHAYPYLAQHIERIQIALEDSPNAGGKIFDTGLFDRDTSFRIQDIAEYEDDLSRMLGTVSHTLLQTAPRELEQRASSFNRKASILLIILITSLAFMPAFMARELKSSMQTNSIRTHQKSINPSALPSN
ncbi:MAG: pilus assembly protein TadE [Cupriavidus sp.]|uniref:toxin corregulated pilus biosynthesis protein E n=3 Tax=Pseudomonadota TaxID=1224 RepID=UPI0002A2653F|nr:MULTISPECIES: toxin corregulated pilus biosynthesis protein E [Cupriavidus]EKZ97090.1 putative toxin corregulated pilus biosynthesis protein E [Cupriavidus sp. HMR-1]MBU66978.1 pilus assembly protein TadE [Cupriavidus sp.]MCA3193884.1 pilus assembly protein TadE [Cupriavidus sp.]MCA3198313.1 pilus assembly protein TadE [Cupriavidus sp.]MCA3233600.1 pilus assembly protein TadE [Cupriavidus sp.]